MKPRRTLGFIAVFVGGLLATLTSVYANHVIAGGVIYSPTSNLPETSVQCQFFGVKSSVTPGAFVVPTTIQCTVMHQGEPMSFSLSTSGTELDPFTVENLNPSAQFPRRVTITGMMLSTLVVGVGTDQRKFTEMASFEAVGEDVADPGADPNRVDHDSFTLTIDYDKSLDIGRLLSDALGTLSDALGTPLVKCKSTCTLTVAGRLIDGDVTSHTSAGD
jgi:hypothetical protein